jgi:hypothetical protein
MNLVIGRAETATQSSQEQFVAVVEKALEGPFLRYSKRLELLELAKELKINRFQANLLIAQVLNREGGLSLSVSDPYESTELPKTNPAPPAGVLRERLFLAAALFIIAALIDMALVKFVFTGGN